MGIINLFRKKKEEKWSDIVAEQKEKNFYEEKYKEKYNEALARGKIKQAQDRGVADAERETMPKKKIDWNRIGQGVSRFNKSFQARQGGMAPKMPRRGGVSSAGMPDFSAMLGGPPARLPKKKIKYVFKGGKAYPVSTIKTLDKKKKVLRPQAPNKRWY